MIAHLKKINSIKGKVGVFVISEKTLDDFFPFGSFKFPSFSTPYRRDHEKFVGELVIV